MTLRLPSVLFFLGSIIYRQRLKSALIIQESVGAIIVVEGDIILAASGFMICILCFICRHSVYDQFMIILCDTLGGFYIVDAEQVLLELIFCRLSSLESLITYYLLLSVRTLFLDLVCSIKDHFIVWLGFSPSSGGFSQDK